MISKTRLIPTMGNAEWYCPTTTGYQVICLLHLNKYHRVAWLLTYISIEISKHVFEMITLGIGTGFVHFGLVLAIHLHESRARKWRPWNPLKIPSLLGYHGFSIYSLVCIIYSCNLWAFGKFVRVNISFQWVHHPTLLVLSFGGAYNIYVFWTYYSVSVISNDINIS